MKVIQAMDGVCAAGITSRTITKARELAKTFHINLVYENIDNLIEKCSLDALMILVSANQIFNITKKMIPVQIPLFIEKPPGLIPEQTKTLVELADKYDTKNMVGYNRRYYSIFHKGIELINQNGRLLGVAIEGHERFWKIADVFRERTRNDIQKDISENWIYANSTHTIDLLRNFGGEVKNINALKNSLHEIKGDQFVASIEFDSGAIGTYTSHWFSPGGWSVKLYGEGITVEYCPLEEGVWVDTNFQVNKIIPDDVDTKYKPGFYKQMEAFRDLVVSGDLDWPGVNLSSALKTMLLTEELVNA